MKVRDWFERVFSRDEEPAEEGVQVPLPASPAVVSNVIVRARDEVQRKKVMQTIAQLSERWGRDNEMVWLLARVDATYEHLEKMAGLDRRSTDWVHELAKAMQVATENVDDVAREAEELSKLLDELGEKSGQDPKS